MRVSRNGMLPFVAAAALTFAGVACDSGVRDARQDAAEAQREADQKAAEAQDKAEAQARDAQRTASEAPSRAGAAVETMDVKAKLMADETVDSSNINVDTFAETRTVVLRGTVPTEAQKKAAERIARNEAEGYKVDNQLKVAPPSR